MGKSKKLQWREELCSFQFWKAVRSEFLGTLFYVFVGSASTVMYPKDSLEVGFSDLTETVAVSLSFGLILATLNQCIGHVSGAHLNPAVSISLLLTRNISFVRTIFYILGQTIGGLSGSGILFGIAGHRVNGSRFFLPQPGEDIHAAQAFGMEFMASFIYVFAVIANLEPRRIEMGSRSLSIGLAAMVAHLASLSISGGALNPVRSLGASLITGVWSSHWIYWAGPILGACIGGLTYEYTQDTQSEIQYLRRSFQRPIGHSVSGHTGFTFTPSSTYENIRSG